VPLVLEITLILTFSRSTGRRDKKAHGRACMPSNMHALEHYPKF
jgi:hypothetical protein